MSTSDPAAGDLGLIRELSARLAEASGSLLYCAERFSETASGARFKAQSDFLVAIARPLEAAPYGGIPGVDLAGLAAFIRHVADREASR